MWNTNHNLKALNLKPQLLHVSALPLSALRCARLQSHIFESPKQERSLKRNFVNVLEIAQRPGQGVRRWQCQGRCLSARPTGPQQRRRRSDGKFSFLAIETRTEHDRRTCRLCLMTDGCTGRTGLFRPGIAELFLSNIVREMLRTHSNKVFQTFQKLEFLFRALLPSWFCHPFSKMSYSD